MPPERPADGLMEKLLRAIELSLKATEASREAGQEILRRGAETGLFFPGPRAPPARSGARHLLLGRPRRRGRRGLRPHRAGPRLPPLALHPTRSALRGAM